MIAASIKSFCIAMLLVAGINSFAVAQSTITDDESRLTVESISVCGDNLFAGTRKGVYRSTDGGKVWRVLSGLPAPGWAFRLASIGKHIFVVGFFPEASMYTSDNNGDTWIKVMTIPADEKVFDVSVFKGRVYAATSKGLFVSADTGAHWSLDMGVSVESVSSVIGMKDYVFAWGRTKSDKNEFYSSTDGTNWVVKNSEGVFPDDIEPHGDNIVGIFCQNNYSMGSSYTCRGYMMWVIGKNAKKWTEVDFKARYFGFDGNNIYAIKVHVTDEKKKEPGYVREIVKSEDGGRSWEDVDEKTDPFVLANNDMQEKLHELDYWKSFEIEEIVAFRRGQKLAAEQRAIELQESLKKLKAAEASYYAPSNTQGNYGKTQQPDYRALSQDRYKVIILLP